MPKRVELTDKVRTNLFSMVLAVLGLLAIAGYGTVAFTTRDLLWFQRGFSERPNRVVVYHDGTKTEYQAGENGYIELAEAVRQCLDSGVVRPSGIGLSAGSLEDAYSMYVSVEAFFADPVKLHSWFNTGNPTQMLFLMTGRHSQVPIVFLGVGKDYFADAPILKTVDPLRSALQTLGYTLQ